MNLTQRIKNQANNLGFSMVGVTSSDPLPHESIFVNWLGQGLHGEMSYLDSPRSHLCRAHPQLILPACRSVLVLGARYPSPGMVNSCSRSGQDAQVAAYAWGLDYHEVLSNRMKQLISFIETQLGQQVPNHWYTDTGPILERELAQRAGLGWIGKNTCLINPKGGSYYFLAEILLSVELIPDMPFIQDRCGTCHRCIDACPTGCIRPDRTLDARRCLSYLTIELRGAIPIELRKKMGRWIFGCDVCQQVCPWNRFASDQVDEAFNPSSVLPNADLATELSLTPQDFNHKYRHSTLKRARRRGYLRNIAVALGNLHSDQATPALVQALQAEPEPLVRAHAAWALGQIGGRIARQALDNTLEIEPDIGVKSEIQSALEHN